MATKSKFKVKRSPKRALKELQKLAKRVRGPDSVMVGLPKGSEAYPDGTSVIMVGAVHEFGSPGHGIPQRSFLRSTMNAGKIKYRSTLKTIAKKVVKGEITKKEGLQLLGQSLQSDVQSKITAIKTPALKYREGNPLIDTAHMRQSIVYIIGEGELNNAN